MIYGSVCSGIEAATVAWEPLGWGPAFYSDIEKFPRAVLAHHYPKVPCHGDFTTIAEGDYEPIDLLVGGTPCQDFSVAGLRAGIAGDRGNLTLEFIRLAARLRPTWIVWENVPGVLSSDGGRAFGSFLGGLGIIGYGYAYRVLDAQFAGLAQRRERVFVVGHFGDWRRAAAVLFESESLRWNPPPSREAGERVAPTISARPTGGGGLGTDFDCDGGLIARCVTAREGNRYDGESTTLIAHALRANGFDASEDGTGRGTPLIAFSSKDHGADAGNISPTLRAMGHSGSHANAGGQVAIAFDARQDPVSGKISGALGTSSPQAQAVAFDLRGRDGGAQFEGPHDTANIRAASGGSSRSYVAESAVRRLTPVECERLQGFPDFYTLIPYRGKPAADGPRYKALGNSMAVPVMRWIGERIDLIMSLSTPAQFKTS